MIRWICKLNNGDSDGEITFYDSKDTTASAKNKLLSGVIKKEVNTAGSFVFEIHKTSSYFSKFQLNTVVCAYGIDTEHSDAVIGNFLGRVSNIEIGFDLVVKITCEDAFGILDDMLDWTKVQRSMGLTENANYLVNAIANWGSNSLMDSFNHYQSTLRDFFQFYWASTDESNYYPVISGWEDSDLDEIDGHIISVDNATTEYDFGWDNEASCLDNLKTYISNYGGYVTIEPLNRKSTSSKIKLFWFPEYTSTPPSALREEQGLDFGTNILSITKEVDVSEIFTRIYPFGKTDYWSYVSASHAYEKIDTSKIAGADTFQQFPLPYVMKSGSDYTTFGYIQDDDLVDEYGIIEKSVVFENAKTNAALETKTANYFKKYKRASLNGNCTINATGIDLATAGKTSDSHWHVGRYVKITSEYHDISGKWFLISAIEQNIFDPSKSKITFNTQPSSFVSKTKNQMSKLKSTTQSNKTETNDTETDLYKKTNANTTAISTKQDTLTAGTGITINGTVISADIESDTATVGNITSINASDYQTLIDTGAAVATTLYLILGTLASSGVKNPIALGSTIFYQKGSTGTVNWFVYSDGELQIGGSQQTKTVSGSGTINMSTEYGQTAIPWVDYQDAILEVSIAEEIQPSYCTYLFSNLTSATKINLKNLDSSKATSFYGMFSGCTNLKSIPYISSLDTENATKFDYMFTNCESLTSVNVSNFNTENATTMYSMFGGCKSLKTLDVSNFDTSQVTIMTFMFNHCESLTTLDLSNFDMSSVTDLGGLVQECVALKTLTLPEVSGENLLNTSFMFFECASIQYLDLTYFCTQAVTNMHAMFYGCTSLLRIYATSSRFKTDSVTDSASMFTGSTKLVGVYKNDDGTVYKTAYTNNYQDKTYARLRNSKNDGYLTNKNYDN